MSKQDAVLSAQHNAVQLLQQEIAQALETEWDDDSMRDAYVAELVRLSKLLKGGSK